MGDQDRGYLLELMLTKLRYATAAVDENHGRGIQVVGMSATLSNAQDLAQWLSAQLYQTSFRPVELRKYVKVMEYADSAIHIVQHVRYTDVQSNVSM